MPNDGRRLLGGLTPSRFLRHHWQKRPLLVRQAVPGFASPLSPDELAGLACEEGVESRIIVEKGLTKAAGPWQLLRGPFDAGTFAGLPKKRWTLLVQGVNRLVPDVAALLDAFDFVPRWRVDDIMISWAPDQGSVGPHVDNYDVFLLQASGRRRWMVGGGAIDVDAFVPGLEVRILRTFEAAEEWVLEPGDMLYLPPRWGHHGVAVGDDCMTYSVGFRAASELEMMTSFVGYTLSRAHDRVDEERRYGDPDLTPPREPGEIDARALAKVTAALAPLGLDGKGQRDEVARWFGRFVTEPRRPDEQYAPRPRAARPAAFVRRLRKAGEVRWNERARYAFHDLGRGRARLFVAGQEIETATALAALITRRAVFEPEDFGALLEDPEAAALLAGLHAAGHLYFPDEE